MADTKLSNLTTRGTPDRAVDQIYVINGGAEYRSTLNNELGITGNPVGHTDIQTLTNKTLTAPTISSPVLSGTITGTYTLGGTPTFPASVATLTGSQTLTNKVLTSPTINTPTITNASITQDAVTGFSTANSGTVYGIGIASGVFTTNNILPNNSLSNTGSFSSAWAWQTWSPTLGGITIGNGTTTGRYTQIGKLVHARLEILWGSTTSQSGSFTFTLPVTASSGYTGARHSIGRLMIWDNSASLSYLGDAVLTSSTVVTPQANKADSTYVYSALVDTITATVPTTWAVSDLFSVDISYEAA